MTDWTGFYLASGLAAAVLTGLLFIAVALRPREMTDAPGLLRARAAFIALAMVTYVSLLELIPGNRLVVGALPEWGVDLDDGPSSGSSTAT